MARLAGMVVVTLLAALPGHAAAATALVTDHVRAELLAHSPQGVQHGMPLWLGLSIEHQPHWHTYWKNPGDSGLPTTLSWTLPTGFTAGDISWPTPQHLPLGPLLNYGYEGRVLLPVPVTVPAGYAGKTLDIKLHAEWLVCKEICLPESGDFLLTIPTAQPTAAHEALFNAARAAVPVTVPQASASARVDGNALAMEVRGLPAAAQGQPLRLMMEDAGVIDYAAKVDQRWTDGTLQLRVPLSAQRSESPAALQIILKAATQPAGWSIPVPLAGGWPNTASTANPGTAGASSAPSANAPAAGAAISSGAAGAASAGAASGAPAFLLTLLFAFIGGAILNLMPCVFPVLSLKLVSLAQHANERKQAVAGGIAYTAGVVLSFAALAGLLLALRAGGEQLGWGFQLQSPTVVFLLAALFTLIGLNLAGVFEFGTMLPSALASFRARNRLLDDALSGALAVAVASPCTAPFMGAAMGAALTESPPKALAIFVVLGLGMAAPYLAASCWPGLARVLPKPGAWMQRFKVLMAFPMFATVVWLAWVLGQQTGIDGMAAALAMLVALAFAAWTLGTPVRTRRTRVLLAGAGLLTLAAAVGTAGPLLRADSGNGSNEVSAKKETQAGARWSAWSETAVAQARAAGKPVFVDFTAAWCVTCQFNKRATLADARLLADFDARNVVLLRADWTRRDPAITQQLARLGRNGVPVYVLYAPGDAPPQLLSELLTVEQVRTALKQL